jgi:transcriptional regulator with XRE-family HTH domain
MARRAGTLDKTVYSPAQRAFCAAITKARKAAGLTQQELAKRLRKPQSFVAKYEGGERRLDVVEFLGISFAIGADPIKLIRSIQKTLR